jgi:TonB family protein
VQGASVAGIDAAYFPFDYYVSQMLNRLSANWYRPPAPPGTACAVRFTVAKSGRILQAEVERPSGVAAFDRAALRAVLSSNPLPPLPFEYNEDKLGIHLKFE